MKQKYILITVLSWLFLLGATAETSVVTIGDDATYKAYRIPYYNYYKNSTTQTLYSASEIGRSGKIKSIAFKVATVTSLPTTEVNVYLGHKSSGINGTSDFVRSSDLTLVYSGAPTLGASTGWETLRFNQGEFTYNGKDNLVVVVTKKSTSDSNTLQYYCMSSGNSLYRKDDYNASYADVTNTSIAYEMTNERPSIRLEIEEEELPAYATAIIGNNATESSSDAPYRTSYKYSTTQMLYTPSEIGKSGKIKSIAFKVATAVNVPTTEVAVYLGHKSSKFSDFSGYVGSSNLTLVYFGKPTLGLSTGWETLEFNRGEFTYNGTDNLVVVVTRKSPDFVFGLSYYCYTGSGYVLGRFSDDYSSCGDVTNIAYSYTTISSRPSIRISFAYSNVVFADTDYTFNDVNYTLHPNNTATVKSVTASWTNIVIPSSLSYEGETFAVTGIGANAFSESINYSITLPTSITSVHADAFKNSWSLSVFWNGSALLTESHINNMKEDSQNVLIYVNSTNQLASSSLQNVANVVVNSTAKSVVLEDGWNFHCPRQFTANSISFTREFILTSGVNGVSAGWETIALPFNVSTIRHSTKGELTPFANYSSSIGKKPFWLYSWSSSGWKKASAITGNTPYLICFPNNEMYHPDYILGGDITFSATNATVYESDTKVLGYESYSYDNRWFLPTFVGVEIYEYFYNTNWGTTAAEAGGETPGSVFLRNYRPTNPFEGFIYSTSAARMFPVFPNVDEETTGILELNTRDSQQTGTTVYDLKGQLVVRTQDGDVEQALKQLPAGMYIVNGKKMMNRR